MEQKASYECPECGLHYEVKETANQCEEFCKTNHACSLEITINSKEAQASKQPLTNTKPHD